MRISDWSSDVCSSDLWVLGSPTDLFQPWMRAAKAAGAPAEASRHTLRHSRITHLLEAGVDIWRVAKLAGDRSVTIDKVYAQASIDHRAQVLKSKGKELLGCSGRTAPDGAERKGVGV